MELKGKKVVVMGLGAATGPALAVFLAGRGAEVLVSEARPEEAVQERLAQLPPGARRECGGHTAETLRWAELVVLSPGVPPGLPVLEEARRRGVEVIGETELAWRFCRGRLIGVTGTKGKSTTSTLIQAMLAAAGRQAWLGGNIGTPLISLVERAGEGSFLVAELSSFQLATAPTLRPEVAVVLNFAADHLDRYSDEEEYLQDKLRISANQEGSDAVVLNLSLARRDRFEQAGAARRFYFATEGAGFPGCFPRGGELVFRDSAGERVLAERDDIRIPGEHNLLNALAALAVAGIVGLPPAACRAALAGFSGLPHRLQLIAEVGGVKYYDDSQGTNIVALTAALRAAPAPIVLIAGGRYKGGDFAELRSLLGQRVRAAVLIGEAAERLAAAWRGAVPLESAASLPEAMRRAAELAPPGGSVLLSPGCSSFDMFRDYRERGEVFQREALKLQAEAEKKTGSTTKATKKRKRA